MATACGFAPAREKSFNIHLIHAETKHNITLDASNGPPTVQQFAVRVAALTKVPIDKQRLIFKGRSLTNMSAPLHSYGMKSGCKVMVLGSKVDMEDDINVKALNAVNAYVSKINEQLDDTTRRFSEINKNLLTMELDGELLNRLDKQSIVCSELFTRQLEKLDSLTLASAPEDVKTSRKSIVLRIQTLLEQSDTLHKDIVGLPIKRHEALEAIRRREMAANGEVDDDFDDDSVVTDGATITEDEQPAEAACSDNNMLPPKDGTDL